ncbi:RNA-directed DNA polymerase, eukaryota, reverse transcriptase zinc-binding domain protein [Tanacetum coccineum]|uniref:RNA-directed DNA polymerase, eukaryota, reverse transcriptase zinc-binding domain protein n=1 Tax=Tanacetum coccineum TaxID=301880 RepID=A0ABQ5F3X6_9ASTR
MAEGEIDNLTMEQYLALTRGNQAPGMDKPEIGGNVNFKIKSQFIRELREDTFSRNKNDNAHEHVERVLDIVNLFNIPGVSYDAIMLRVFPITLIGAAKRCRNIESSSNSEGITAIVNKLENLGRDMKKLKENVYAIQVGCQTCEGAHLDKDCPLNKEVKGMEEVKYEEFSQTFPNNRYDGRFNKGGYDQPSSGEKRPSLTKVINKYMEEASKRQVEQDERLKKFYQSIEASLETHDKIIQGLEGKEIEYFSANLGFSNNEEQETDDSGMAEAVASLEATLKKKREEPKKLEWENLSLNDLMRIRYGKVCKMTGETILKDHWKERFGGEEDNLEKYLEDPEECREDKANTMLGVIHDKLNNDWFNNTSEDEDDLEGILDYLKPRSYDGFINLDDEAYNKRRCRLFGMTYGEPTPILIEKAKVTRYTVYPGETYTKVKVLGVEKIPRTRDNVAAMRARLMKKIAQEGNNQAKTFSLRRNRNLRFPRLVFMWDQVSILAKDKGFGQEMHQSEEPKGNVGSQRKCNHNIGNEMVRFILRYENKDYVLDKQISTIDDDSTQEEIEAHQKHYDDVNKVSCIMESSMSPELQKTFKNTWAYEINQQLKEMFQAKASKEHLDVMKGYFDRLESLNMMFNAELSINIILFGLPEAPMLTVGHNAKKRNTFHSNWKGKAAKGKSNCGSKRKVESEIAPTSDLKEAVCFYCNTKGHWKCSCPKFEGPQRRKGRKGYSLGYGLKESRRLKHGELNLVMGNRKIMPVTRIGK